jgi:hypothetical protein
MAFDLGGVDEKEIRREKEKARRLRRTNWWYTRIQKGECYYCQADGGSRKPDHGPCGAA